MKITEIVLGADHPGLEAAEDILSGMTNALILIGQGTIVQMMEDGNMSSAQAVMLTNQMFSHFAQNTPKTSSN